MFWSNFTISDERSVFSKMSPNQCHNSIAIESGATFNHSKEDNFSGWLCATDTSIGCIFNVQSCISIYEYAFGFYVLLSAMRSAAVYSSFVWVLKNTVKFIKICGEFIAISNGHTHYMPFIADTKMQNLCDFKENFSLRFRLLRNILRNIDFLPKRLLLNLISKQKKYHFQVPMYKAYCQSFKDSSIF